MPKILCVDDEQDNLDALERIFRKKYAVFKTLSGLEGFKILQAHPDISIIISDQRMPEISGVEFLEKSVATHPDTIRILLTGYTDIESVISAINKGQIFRYITKPWDTTDLANTVDRAFEKFQLRSELNYKNNELKKALSELEQLDKAKSQFMILINHELKTPLTAIVSFAALLKETTLDDEQKLFVDRINKSSDKLTSIIDDVLLIVKGEVSLIQSKKEAVLTKKFLGTWSQDFENTMKAKNQKLVVSAEIDQIQTDPFLLKTVINRALHNASKFGKAGSSVSLTLKKNMADTEIDIFNEGPPISENLIEKIYKPFLLDENVMNHSIGMGLGLTICNTLMRAMNGKMNIKNELNGVRITFIV